MRRHIIISLMLLASIFCVAKKNDTPRADIMISYSYNQKFVRGDDGVISRSIPMLLIAGQQQSKFYSPHSNRLDSLESTPKGRAVSDQLFNAALDEYMRTKDRSAMRNVSYKTYLYVFKDLKEMSASVYDITAMVQRAWYSEPLGEIQWQIGDSTKTVLGYECIKAETDYHGRHWSVWFTPEIPLQDGPWKLCGLPGLILEANEPSGQHSFIADGIEHCDMEITPIYNKSKYDHMNRLDMLRDMRKYTENSASMMNAQLNDNIFKESAKSPESDKYDFLETDYH